MFVTILNDCADSNAAGRQVTRAATLFGVTPIFVPLASSLDDAAQLGASGMLVDMLDAAGGHEGVILVNVAPRSGTERHWGNGTPFCYFRVEKTLIVSTLSGVTLSLAHRCGLTRDLAVLDLAQTVEMMVEQGTVHRSDAAKIIQSQFRSFDFLPRVAHHLYTGGAAASRPHALSLPDPGERVWLVDSFGNCKTTLTEASLHTKNELVTKWGTFPFVRSLKDVSDGTPAATVGSSGYGDERFVELVVQGESMAARFNVRPGDSLS